MEPTSELRDHLQAQAADRVAPLIVALDGRSGAGKSTLAAAVAAGGLDRGPATVQVSIIEGDDFYAGGRGLFWDSMTAAQKVSHCIDWRRQRPILDQLRRGRAVRWYPFDWDAFDGRLSETARGDEAEELYFGTIRPPSSFDLILTPAA